MIHERLYVKQDPIFSLPDELVVEVLSYLNLAALGAICSVSKEWKRLARDSTLWKIAIYREIAFGNDKWAGCFGKDVVKDEDSKEEFSSLPWKDFIDDCKKFKNRNSLMLVRLPKTLNGGLTLRSLGEVVNKCFGDDYRTTSPGIVDELENKPIHKSYWVMMTKDVLPGSRHKSYAEQQQIVAGLAEKFLIGYEVPGTLESAVCILSQYFALRIRLFSDNPLTYTRCKEKYKGNQIIVGGFILHGLGIFSYPFDGNLVGVAAMRKF